MPAKKVARPNTLVIQVPEAFRSGSKEDFLAKLLESLNAYVLLCVQFIPGFLIRITFDFLESRRAVLRNGLALDGVDIPVMEADSTVRFVHLHHCPFEVSDRAVAGALSGFATVLDIQFSYYAGSTVRNGSRVVKMSLQEEIPTKLFVLRYPCRVWYRGQVQDCNICRSPEHRAASCPLRDLCLKCRQRGHFARDCPGLSADGPVVDVASVPAADVPTADVPIANVSTADVPVCDVSSPPVPLLRAVTSLVRNAVAVADFCQPLASQEVISSILARGAARRRPVPVPSPSSVDVNPPSPSVSASVSSCRNPFAVFHPDPLSPGIQLVFDFHNQTRRIVAEDSATFEMYRECFYCDNRGPFPVKSVFLPGRPVSSSVTFLDPSVLPTKFPS